MMCTRCKKRPAAVFITSMNGQEKKNEGLCLVCARELGISQVDDYMKSMGISDDDLEMLTSQMMEASDGDDFEPGGSPTMPSFLSNMLGQFSNPQSNSASEKSGVTAGESEAESIKEKKKERGKDKKDKKSKLKFLPNYATNLTERARDGKLDNIIGRDKEIARVVQILSRRQKNNPCLIGEPGVGKTAIAEGIAQRIVADDVPYHLKGKELYLLDLTAMVAGTQFRGQFESRVKGLVEEVKSLGNVILFIDEVHNLVGAGDSAEGSMNAANILKPALSRGEIQVIGATTFKEYRKYIEKDAALERRFQPVTVSEPTLSDTIEVLQGIRKYYEEYHKVKIDDATLRMCAILSERYINDRFLPDKAIDLLDEACARTSIRSPELAELAEISKELEAKNAELAELEGAESPDFEKIAEIKADILRIEENQKELQQKADNIKVGEEDLPKVIELWTGIPANKVVETEYSKIRNLKESLSKRVIGQEQAIDAVAKAVKRTRVGLSKRRRPASFIFVGPTGVGKTELVKVLGEELFDATEPLIRVDMSEYMERHSVAKLIGSPPGYVGYDEAGQLTEKVRRRPYSVILFDEIEKAHPDVMNILLQILDEGKITDAQGRNVSFENTVIVMTSNAGSTSQETGVGFNKTNMEISKEKAMKGLRDFLRPEFLGRVDEVVVFNPLTEENYADICALMLDEMKEPLAEKGIEFEYDRKACVYIAHKSHNQKLGARDIRRVIRREVEDKIASVLIDELRIETKHLSLTEENGKLKVEAE
ncbi:MAG: ATP-dependent Clp protease ATP-binding subunit [Ruminococcus sp.]|nr:ATP-dependent Clp protease ATP-binding subunit [Ruminococcus sp.]